MSAAAASPKTRSEALVEAEFVLSRRNFENIAGLLRTESGIHLPESKAMLVYSRLAKRLRQTGCPDFDAYWELIDSPAGAQERQAMFAALTTNVTRFFREPHHFDHLREKVLAPRIAAVKAGRARHGHKRRRSCAGAGNAHLASRRSDRRSSLGRSAIGRFRWTTWNLRGRSQHRQRSTTGRPTPH